MLKKLLYNIECYPCKTFLGTIYYNKNYRSQTIDFSKYEQSGTLGMIETVIHTMSESMNLAANLDTFHIENAFVRVDLKDKCSSLMKTNMVLVKFINKITKKISYDLLSEEEFRESNIGQDWIEKHGYRTWE